MSSSTASGGVHALESKPSVVVQAKDKHSATMFFFHGLGDQGDGWGVIFREDMRIGHFKTVIPNSASRPVTLNFGMRMPAWYDLYGLTVNAQEDERGIEAAKQYVHGLIDVEVARGIPSERIALGGFSMGGALALYAGLTYHRPLGCIVSFSGFLLQRTKLPGTHTANLNVPIFLGHGRNDFLVPIEIGRLTEQALKAFNSKTEFHDYSVEHSTTKQEQDDAMAFIKKHVPKN